MQVDVTLTSQSDCGFNSYFADGDLALTKDGFVLEYILDGKDKNSLVYNGKSICQSRSGGLTYTVEFVEGQMCYFLFKEMGLEFSRGVAVHKAAATVNKNGCSIEISYSDSVNRDDITLVFVTAAYKNNKNL